MKTVVLEVRSAVHGDVMALAAAGLVDRDDQAGSSFRSMRRRSNSCSTRHKSSLRTEGVWTSRVAQVVLRVCKQMNKHCEVGG
jgi:hypothetical protein